MNFAALLVSAVLICSGVEAQRNQGIRLASSPLGEHAGRVEVRYNGRWGTICDDGWSQYDGRVVCSMLGMSGYVCAVQDAVDTFGQGTGPVWLRNLRCRYFDDDLDDCRHDGVRQNSCPHSQDAAVICQDNTTMPIPYNITAVKATITSVTISWMLDFIPPYIGAINFKIYYRDTVNIAYRLAVYETTVNESSTDFMYTISSLLRNRTYEVYIRADGKYLQWCRYNVLMGVNSDEVNVTTNAIAPPSTLPMRIVPVRPEMPYIGRLEVYHDGEWGTVCDDLFDQVDAQVACYGLNYTDGAICYATSGFLRGTGRIWLDDVDCRGEERFEDCRHNGWGLHDCGHSEDVGLVCNPGNADLPAVTNFQVTKVGDTYVTLQWDPIRSFNGRYRLLYQSASSTFGNVRTLSPSVGQYSILRLQLGLNYSIQIRSELNLFGYRGSCYYSPGLSSGYTDPIYVVTQESAPDVSTTDFHITVLNRSAVEATWRLPLSGLNGRVTRFKIFVEKFNGSARVISIEDNTTMAYIIAGLEPTTQYTFSMLIATIADGPRGIHLTQIMPDSGFVPTITLFGIYGDGIERVTKYTFHRGFNVLCGSPVKDITIYWQYVNGSRIGIKNRSFREGHFENGTAVLQVGTASLYTRYLTVCDGGVYTCVAIGPDGATHKRNFTLIVGSSPPAPSPPYVTRKGSTWVQVAWNAMSCDGGYQIHAYDVEYRTRAPFSYTYTTAGRVSSLNYTVRNLIPSSEYDVRVQAISRISFRESSSRFISVTTDPAGPSPPRSLSVRVTSSPEVCMRWRDPATPNGMVSLYRVYAEPLNTSRDIRVAIDLPITKVVKTFHGSDRTGCMIVNETNVIYQIRMSAVAFIGGEPIEGDLSDVTPQSIVFIPKPGLPQVSNPMVASVTNSSVALKWNTPRSLPRGLINYKVSYSGIVQWTSNGGVFIQFPESGQLNTTNTNITISPLTPSTSYMFKISMVTTEGEGAEVMTEATTRSKTGDKLAYFQLKILNSKACEEWHGDDSEMILAELQQFLATILNSQCKCGVIPSHISEGEFSCRTRSDETINYRARIKGTSSRSASDLVALIQSWVQSGQASVLVGSARYPVDGSCNAFLDNIHALDCGSEPVTPSPNPPSRRVGNDDSGDDMSSAQVGGIIVGGFILGILLTLLIMLIVALILWKKNKTEKDPRLFKELVNEPSSSRASAVFPDDTVATDKL